MDRLSKTISITFALLLLLSAGLFSTGQAFGQAQEKPTLVVKEFSIASGVQWPYTTKQLQMATVAELMSKCGARAQIVSDVPEKKDNLLLLEGEILSWKAGNRATRLMVGLGAGRETANIHFSVTDSSGKTLYEHTDTIRQSVWGGGYTPSVGELVQPFANKIATRVSESKVFGPGKS